MKADNTFIISHSPRMGNPKKGGTEPLVSTEYAFTVDSSPHLVVADRTRNYAGLGRNLEVSGEQANALTSVAKDNLLMSDASIRRLTPTECERLQGFPDGWTEGVPDSVRYKLLGNAVTVPVIEFLGKRILREIAK